MDDTGPTAGLLVFLVATLVTALVDLQRNGWTALTPGAYLWMVADGLGTLMATAILVFISKLCSAFGRLRHRAIELGQQKALDMAEESRQMESAQMLKAIHQAVVEPIQSKGRNEQKGTNLHNEVTVSFPKENIQTGPLYVSIALSGIKTIPSTALKLYTQDLHSPGTDLLVSGIGESPNIGPIDLPKARCAICRVTNDGTVALKDICIKIIYAYGELHEDVGNVSVSYGKKVEGSPIYIYRLDPGPQNSYEFYIINGSDYAILAIPPSGATLGLGESPRTTVPVFFSEESAGGVGPLYPVNTEYGWYK